MSGRHSYLIGTTRGREELQMEETRMYHAKPYLRPAMEETLTIAVVFTIQYCVCARQSVWGCVL